MVGRPAQRHQAAYDLAGLGRGEFGESWDLKRDAAQHRRRQESPARKQRRLEWPPGRERHNR